ncbi:uncharacterized protein K441DRAFT_652649 [Cenococcum geophilum 1.58]|uniref:uncharacterized protein n=1 Tax=Cenococcum geophilum 1.58 TaxID=794803 RepID=UPI00358EC248|nr:hypothetical protein K441DRAFT_652649 [Cenococcum geophilum 1.58]
MAWEPRSSILHRSAAEQLGRADSPLALNQQIERRLRNIRGNTTILPDRHAWPPRRCSMRYPFK